MSDYETDFDPVAIAFRTLDNYTLSVLDRAPKPEDGWVLVAWVLAEVTSGEEVPGLTYGQVTNQFMASIERLIIAAKLEHKISPTGAPFIRRVNVLERIAKESNG